METSFITLKISKMWARYDCKTGEKEDLIDHLKRTGETASKIAKCLEGILGINMENEALIAGHFHDLFKVVYQPEDISKFCEQNEKLTFRYHEIASAIFLGNYALKVDDKNMSPLKEEQIRRVVKAVLFHHQGLRVITLQNFYEGFYDILKKINKKRDEIEKMVNYVLNQLGYKTISNINEYLDFRTLEGMLIKVNEYDRLLSGILIVADNYTVLRSLNKRASRLLEDEIIDFLRAVSLS